jgi:hypothetical protein
MRALFILLISISLPAGAFAQDVLIENVTVVSSSTTPPLANAHVLLRDGRVAAIDTKPLTAPSNAVRLDGRGKFLTPGITDSHVHITSTPGLPSESRNNTQAAQALRDAYYQQQPRSYLYFGVTQVLDLIDNPKGRASFESQPLHPDLFHCGAAPVVDGYGIGASAPTFIFEPANAAKHPMPQGSDPEQHTPEAAVQAIAATRPLCVKVFIEDGFGSDKSLPLISDASLQRLRAAAHKRDLLVVAHANAIDMLRIAVTNDVDVIAHGTWNWLEADDQPGVPEAIASQLREVHRKNIGFQPTLQVIEGLGSLFDPATLADPNVAKVVPSAVLAWYRSDDAAFFKREIRSNFPKDLTDQRVVQIFSSVRDQGARALKYLFDLGRFCSEATRRLRRRGAISPGTTRIARCSRWREQGFRRERSSRRRRSTMLASSASKRITARSSAGSAQTCCSCLGIRSRTSARGTASTK